MGGRLVTPSVSKPKRQGSDIVTPIDNFRLFMFRVAYDRMYATESDLVLRFAKALVYSSREMTAEQEQRAYTLDEDLAAMAKQMEEERED
jgi:hypothetical protein